MTQQAIFDILLYNNQFTNDIGSHITPTLIPGKVDNISSKLTNMLYDSLKTTSSTSASRRANLLKFLQNIISPCHRHHHVMENGCSCVLSHLDNSYKKKDEIEQFLQKCEQEVNENNFSLYQKIMNGQKAKYLKQKALNVQREIRYKNIQSTLSSIGIVCDITQGDTVYQPNEKGIKFIFGIDEKVKSSESISCTQNGHLSIDYRLKQIRFGYAIYNIGTKLEIEKYIDIIVNNLKSYDQLHDFEKDFLRYLFKTIGKLPNYNKICNEFFFILEIDVISMCTKIVQLEDASDVQQLLDSSLENEEFNYLKLICSEDKYLSTKIKNVFYNLYGYSFCNVNILKLMNLLI